MRFNLWVTQRFSKSWSLIHQKSSWPGSACLHNKFYASKCSRCNSPIDPLHIQVNVSENLGGGTMTILLLTKCFAVGNCLFIIYFPRDCQHFGVGSYLISIILLTFKLINFDDTQLYPYSTDFELFPSLSPWSIESIGYQLNFWAATSILIYAPSTSRHRYGPSKSKSRSRNANSLACSSG